MSSYSWPRDGLIPAASALLESLWAAPWIGFYMATSTDQGDFRYPFPWVLALLLVPTVIGRWLDRSFWGPRLLRQYGLTVLVLGLFVPFVVQYHDVASSWLVAAILLGRGIWLAVGDVTSESAAGWFLAGLGAFLALLALQLQGTPAGFEGDVAGLGPALALYLFAGLAWVALVRQDEMEELAFRRSSHSLNVPWVLLLGAISAVMVSVTAAASSAGQPLIAALELLLAAVLRLIWQIATQIAIWILPAIVWLLSKIPLPPVRALARSSQSRRPLLDRGGDLPLLQWLQDHLPLQYVLALAGGVVVVLLAWWLTYRFRGMLAEGPADEERTSLWSWRLFWQQLRAAVAGMRLSLPSPGSVHPARGSAVDARPALHSVRQLYAAVLAWCAQHERPRHLAQTPFEFAHTLREETAPDLADDLTAAYVRVRYGQSEPPDAPALIARWERWQAAALQLKDASDTEDRRSAEQ